MNGEADCGALPGAGIVSARRPDARPRRVQRRPPARPLHEERAAVNKVFGTKLPALYSSRAWAIHTEVIEKHPERFALLERTARQVFDQPAYKRGLREDRRAGRDHPVRRPRALHALRRGMRRARRTNTGRCSRPSPRLMASPNGRDGQDAARRRPGDSGARARLRRLLLLLDRRPRLGSQGERRADRRDSRLCWSRIQLVRMGVQLARRGEPAASSALLAPREALAQADRPGADHRRVHRRDPLARADARALALALARGAVHHGRAEAQRARRAAARASPPRRICFSSRCCDSDLPRGPIEQLLALSSASVTWAFLLEQFATQFGLWWVICRRSRSASWSACCRASARRTPSSCCCR